MEDSVSKIVDGLLQKSKEKKAKWLESSTKGEFKILFDGGTVTIGQFRDNYGKEYYQLRILNSEGKVIVRETDFLMMSPSNRLKNLYLAAQESCLKKKDTLDSILAQLNGDVVGEDDLPF